MVAALKDFQFDFKGKCINNDHLKPRNYLTVLESTSHGSRQTSSIDIDFRPVYGICVHPELQVIGIATDLHINLGQETSEGWRIVVLTTIIQISPDLLEGF